MYFIFYLLCVSGVTLATLLGLLLPSHFQSNSSTLSLLESHHITCGCSVNPTQRASSSLPVFLPPMSKILPGRGTHSHFSNLLPYTPQIKSPHITAPHHRTHTHHQQRHHGELHCTGTNRMGFTADPHPPRLLLLLVLVQLYRGDHILLPAVSRPLSRSIRPHPTSEDLATEAREGQTAESEL